MVVYIYGAIGIVVYYHYSVGEHVLTTLIVIIFLLLLYKWKQCTKWSSGSDYNALIETILQDLQEEKEAKERDLLVLQKTVNEAKSKVELMQCFLALLLDTHTHTYIQSGSPLSLSQWRNTIYCFQHCHCGYCLSVLQWTSMLSLYNVSCLNRYVIQLLL